MHGDAIPMSLSLQWGYTNLARTWCNPNGGPYRSATWSTPMISPFPLSVDIGTELILI